MGSRGGRWGGGRGGGGAVMMKIIMKRKKCLISMGSRASSVLFLVVFIGAPGLAIGGKSLEERATLPTPETRDIPLGGILKNFVLVGHNPLRDSDRGASDP